MNSETERKLLDNGPGKGGNELGGDQWNTNAGPGGKTNRRNSKTDVSLMPPTTQGERNIVMNISSKLKATFWNYYKDHKTDMIEEQSFNGSYFKDEHGFDSSGSSGEDEDAKSANGSVNN